MVQLEHRRGGEGRGGDEELGRKTNSAMTAVGWNPKERTHSYPVPFSALCLQGLPDSSPSNDLKCPALRVGRFLICIIPNWHPDRTALAQKTRSWIKRTLGYLANGKLWY